MNKIISKRFYSENVAEIVVEAPLIARSRKAGHFVIVRVDEHGERMPLTISDADVNNGTITLVVQRIGVSSNKLCALNAGDSVADLVGQPYKTATQSGISQMAYHFEKPMVVTAVGGLPEIVPHGKVGYVVPVDDKAVADAVVDFFDHHTAADFAAYIKEEKKKYTWENFCNVVRQYFL